MKPRVFAFLLLGVAIALPFTIRADQERNPTDRDDRDCRDNDHHEHNVKTPVGLIGVIPVPGNPITSADIAWVDPGTERYYVADRSNFGVDIIDAENDLFVARVTGMAGPLTSSPMVRQILSMVSALESSIVSDRERARRVSSMCSRRASSSLLTRSSSDWRSSSSPAGLTLLPWRRGPRSFWS